MSEIDVVKLRRLAENAKESVGCHVQDEFWDACGINVVLALLDRLEQAEAHALNVKRLAGRASERIELLARAERAEAAIERVRALHRNGGSSQGRTGEGYGYIKNCCETCGEFGEYGVEWPCPTVAALDEEDEK